MTYCLVFLKNNHYYNDWYFIDFELLCTFHPFINDNILILITNKNNCP